MEALAIFETTEAREVATPVVSWVRTAAGPFAGLVVMREWVGPASEVNPGNGWALRFLRYELGDDTHNYDLL